MLEKSIETNKIIETNKQIKKTKSILKNMGLALMIVLVSGLYGCKKIKTNEVKDDKKIVLIESLFKDIKKRIDSLEMINYPTELNKGIEYVISEDGKTITLIRNIEGIISDDPVFHPYREFGNDYRLEPISHKLYIEVSNDDGITRIGGLEEELLEKYYTESAGDSKGEEERIRLLTENEAIKELRVFTKDLK